MFRFLPLAFLLIVQHVKAGGPFTPIPLDVVQVEELLADSTTTDTVGHHPSRALTAALALTLGPFGAHRLYLGTAPKVPLIYGLTFGGFGVLVVIDLAHILFTKDLSAYQGSERIFMWARPRAEETTPP